MQRWSVVPTVCSLLQTRCTSPFLLESWPPKASLCASGSDSPFWTNCIGAFFSKTVHAPALNYAGSEVWYFVRLKFTSSLLDAPGSCVLWDMDKSAPLCLCAVSGMVLCLYQTMGSESWDEQEFVCFSKLEYCLFLHILVRIPICLMTEDKCIKDTVTYVWNH